ncbi:SAP domain-containing ribonucleoprotein isoform 1-T1 [Leptodactylus fuscus]|uniref:SAP domain-containing ribonucleoprotein isoform X1 n=1 Tax=Leptodactylus fuscus TaxID=238119 RepID=UPI003F4E9D15
MADIVEIHKLKLAELKQECLARGLDVKGNKSDLVNRLQAYLEEHAEEEANEEDVLGDETEEEEPKPAEAPLTEDEPSVKPEEKSQHEQMCNSPSRGRGEESLAQQSHVPFASMERKETEKKLVKITSSVSQADRLQKRAERFSVPVNADSKKAARAIRFGMPSGEEKGDITAVKTTVSMDKLKERAQRFGLSVSPVTKKSEDDEKLKKRKERFGIVTSSASVTDDIEAKKRKRSERFGIV